jgi:hypothetical protein
MSKSKREEAEPGDAGYEFQLPEFDEGAFVRREVLGARAAFVALGLGAVGGALAAVLWLVMGGANWALGWIPILAAVLGFRPVLQALKYPEDVTSVRATFGSLFMILFTGLAVWIVGINL